MQSIDKIILPNGLTIIFIIDNSFSTSTVQMSFPAGWRNDPEKHVGLAHLFEHLVGKRTADYKNKGDLVKELEKNGIRYDALTSPGTTTYFHKQNHEDLLKSLMFLFEAIYSSRFDKEDLINEKEIVLTEARQYKDNDINFSWHNTAKGLFKNTTLEKFFFGDEETLKDISVEIFEDYYKLFKNPKNSVLFISTNSNLEKDVILEYINNFYTKYKDLTEVKIPRITDNFSINDKYVKVEKGNKAQATLNLAYKHEKLSVKETVYFRLLQAILVNGLSGKIKVRLRDELNLIYNISFYNMNFQDISMSYFSTNCKKEKVDAVILEIKESVNKIIRNLSQTDIDEFIKISLFNHADHKNSFSETAFISKSFFTNDEYITYEQYIETLKTISLIDLENLCKKIFIDENLTVCILA